MNIITVAASTPQYTRNGEGDAIELNDGRLLLIYMQFTGDGSDHAVTRFVAVNSADAGKTWSDLREITTTLPGDMNVYSPNLIRGADGSILLLFMRQHNSQPRTSTQYVWQSRDEGQSFIPRNEFAVAGGFSLCNAVIKRLSTGRLLLPVAGSAQQGERRIRFATALHSDDDGRTWRESESYAYLPMRGAMEPHVEETRDGRVLMVMRNQLGSLFISESRDAGVTWSKPQTTGLRTPESCPELTRIPSTGDLLMIWNNSPYDPAFRSHYGKRSPLTAAVSTDEGKTWKHLRDIETDPTRAFSNPGCRFTRNGAAIINYWTCEYCPDWAMQDVIDLRVALVDTPWFYERA